MRGDGFRRSIVFAAAAGGAWPAAALLAAPLLGPATALGLYLVALASLYVAALAGARAGGLVAGLAVAAWGLLLLAVARGPLDVALGAALAIGVARGAFLSRARPARALAREALLLGGGLALARFLLTPGTLGVALAIWGFFAVQAAFFGFGSAGPVSDAAAPDPFAVARARALALLDEER